MKLNPKMKLPDAVNICGMVFPITLIKDLKAPSDNTKVDGLFSRAPAGISIEANLADQERWHTFFHEMLHGWLAMSSIIIKDEEMKIDALAYQAFSTIFNTDWKK